MAGVADPEVTDNTGASRFEARVDGHLAQLVYRVSQGRLYLVHTQVPEELEGHGLGGVLVRAAVDSAEERGLTVVAQCPFARGWLQRHADVAARVPVEGL